MNNGLKTTILALAPLLAGIGVYLLLISMKTPPPKKADNVLRTLKALPLVKKETTPKIIGYATVTPSSDIQISAEVNGKVVFCNKTLSNGCNVKKGTILIKIEKEDYEIAVNQATALADALVADTERTSRNIEDLEKLLRLAKQDFSLEEKNYNRVKDLFKKKVTSQSEVERARQVMARRNKVLIEMSNTHAKAKFNLRILNSRVKDAKAKLKQAKLNLSRTTITAPLSGRIDNCAVDKDEYLKAGQPVCSIKVDVAPELSVSINSRDFATILNIIPDTEVHWFNIPKDMKVTAFWMEAPLQCRWTMSVSRVIRYNPSTDTIAVLIAAKSYAGSNKKIYNLIPGMFCEVVFEAPPIKAYRIPFVSLQLGDNVYTIDDTGTLHRNHVTPFHIEGDSVLIRTGLPNGEMVVAQPLPRGLVAGMKVKAVVPDEKVDGEQSPVVSGK
jgi:RND family efflux transporter MFP subunit